MGTIKAKDMDKLIFNGKEYELIEVNHDKFRIYSNDYDDIGFTTWEFKDASIPVYDCYSLRIKDRYYGLKLIEK
jgi:hypothetical protein